MTFDDAYEAWCWSGGAMLYTGKEWLVGDAELIEYASGRSALEATRLALEHGGRNPIQIGYDLRDWQDTE